MIVTLVRKIKAKDLIKEFEDTYGSIDRLKKLHDRDGGNMKSLTDLEDWEYLIKHPDEIITDGTTIFPDKLVLGKSEMEILNSIKHGKPQSIRELARLINKDVSTIHPKIKELEEEGLLTLEEGSKNRKIPVLTYDEIKIEV